MILEHSLTTLFPSLAKKKVSNMSKIILTITFFVLDTLQSVSKSLLYWLPRCLSCIFKQFLLNGVLQFTHLLIWNIHTAWNVRSGRCWTIDTRRCPWIARRTSSMASWKKLLYFSLFPPFILLSSRYVSHDLWSLLALSKLVNSGNPLYWKTKNSSPKFAILVYGDAQLSLVSLGDLKSGWIRSP